MSANRSRHQGAGITIGSGRHTIRTNPNPERFVFEKPSVLPNIPAESSSSGILITSNRIFSQRPAEISLRFNVV